MDTEECNEHNRKLIEKAIGQFVNPDDAMEVPRDFVLAATFIRQNDNESFYYLRTKDMSQWYTVGLLEYAKAMVLDLSFEDEQE